MKKLLLAATWLITSAVYSQKKPLDHTVYDSWQTIAERAISNDGKYVSYAVNPQEGDGVLVVQAVSGTYKKEIPRGYGVTISYDSRFVVCRIRPPFKDTREARIKKKRPDDMPKDSLAILELGRDAVVKIPRVKSYKLPDDSGAWLAYLLEKNEHTIAPKVAEEAAAEGTDLILRNLITGETTLFKLISEFFFNKKGNVLLVETTRSKNDSASKASVMRVDLNDHKTETILSGFNDAKGYRMDEAGKQLAFVL